MAALLIIINYKCLAVLVQFAKHLYIYTISPYCDGGVFTLHFCFLNFSKTVASVKIKFSIHVSVTKWHRINIKGSDRWYSRVNLKIPPVLRSTPGDQTAEPPRRGRAKRHIYTSRLEAIYSLAVFLSIPLPLNSYPHTKLIFIEILLKKLEKFCNL